MLGTGRIIYVDRLRAIIQRADVPTGPIDEQVVGQDWPRQPERLDFTALGNREQNLATLTAI